MGKVIVSLFDGMSGGQLSADLEGLDIFNYYASEIEPKSMLVTQKNYPNTIQIGDVSKVSYKNGVLYTENGEFNVGKIDMVIGGSPCQGLSAAKTGDRNKIKGKDLEDPRSMLFYEYIRIKNECNPEFFLLENVKMNKESNEEFNRLTGVEGILIDSNLVSAQNRKRLYWTNIPGVVQPDDMGILVKDILQEEPCLLFSDERIANSRVKTKNYYKWDVSGKGYYSQQDRAYYKDGKMCCVPKSQVKSKVNVVEDEENGIYRRLSPIEVERLQTVPDDYTLCEGVSNGKRYEMIGNGWTISVIRHIFSFLPEDWRK